MWGIISAGLLPLQKRDEIVGESFRNNNAGTTCLGDAHCRAYHWLYAIKASMQAVQERQAALMPAANHKSVAAFPVMAAAPQQALASISMSGLLQSAPAGGPELLPVPSARHAIGGGTVQVCSVATASIPLQQECGG